MEVIQLRGKVGCVREYFGCKKKEKSSRIPLYSKRQRTMNRLFPNKEHSLFIWELRNKHFNKLPNVNNRSMIFKIDARMKNFPRFFETLLYIFYVFFICIMRWDWRLTTVSFDGLTSQERGSRESDSRWFHEPIVADRTNYRVPVSCVSSVARLGRTALLLTTGQLPRFLI